MRQLAVVITVLAFGLSACAPSTYVARVEHVDNKDLPVIPAVRERDGMPVALARGTYHRVDDASRPEPAPAMVRVGGRGHRHPLARAGIGVFVAGTLLSVLGAVLAATTVCIGLDSPSQCQGHSNAPFFAGASLSVMGDAAFLIAGPVMWGVGANLEPRELRYEPTAQTTPIVGVRF